MRKKVFQGVVIKINIFIDILLLWRLSASEVGRIHEPSLVILLTNLFRLFHSRPFSRIHPLWLRYVRNCIMYAGSRYVPNRCSQVPSTSGAQWATIGKYIRTMVLVTSSPTCPNISTLEDLIVTRSTRLSSEMQQYNICHRYYNKKT